MSADNEGFGNVKFDPEKQALDEKNAGRGLSNTSVGKGSTYKRGSVAALRASMQREPGWDKRQSINPLGSVGDYAGEGEEINYNTLIWWQAGMIMIAETVSLGILALPSVLATIGMVPGIILILGLGVVATYTGYVIGQFRLRHPWVHSFGDVGEIIGKPLHMSRFLAELFGWAQVLFQIFTMASHVLTFTICMNTLTDSATCTMVWGVIGLAIFVILDLPRTLGSVSYMSIASFISILSAVLVTMIDVGVTKPIGDGKLKATAALAFTDAFLSVSNITFAYAGHSCYFGFIAEMKNPEDWPKALAFLQICDIALYLTTAVVVYRYAGDEVASPALGSATGVVKKVAWGVALPTIMIAAVIYGHVASKYIFVRMFRGTKHLTVKTKLSYVTWYGIVASVWILAWIIAESIPAFNDLLGLISSIFGSAFTYYIPGWLWLYMNWTTGPKGWFLSWRKIACFSANILAITIGILACVLGLWASGVGIAEHANGAVWTCKSNAQ